MIRDVHLLDYLPPIMQTYREIKATLDAEDPEFKLVWTAVDQVLSNEFITTADEYGISRFEKILGILPYAEDTLESRRTRVLARWFQSLPYTLRMLVQKLVAICGEDGFTLTYDFTTGYWISLETYLDGYGEVEEIEKFFESWLPMNMVYTSTNQIKCRSEGEWLFGGGIVYCETVQITNDSREAYRADGTAYQGGGVVSCEAFLITNDSQEKIVAESTGNHGGGVAVTEIIQAQS